MANRRGYVFGTDKFRYEEIDDLPDQWTILRDTRFVETIGGSMFRNWLISLPKPDLTLLIANTMCETLFRKSWKKNRLIDLVTMHIDRSDAFVPECFVA